jgi:DNA-binding response OmpR family regulator
MGLYGSRAKVRVGEASRVRSLRSPASWSQVYGEASSGAAGELAVNINPDPDRVLQVGDITIDVAGVLSVLAAAAAAAPAASSRSCCCWRTSAGRVLSADSIRRHIWGEGFVDATGNLKVHVNRLRKRITAHLGGTTSARSAAWATSSGP